MSEWKMPIAVGALGVALLVWWWHFLQIGADLRELGIRAAVAMVGDALDRETRSVTGWRTKDCGRVPVAGGHREVTECALRQFSDGHPFRARYDIQGKDSVVSISIVRVRTGQLVKLSADDESQGTRWQLPIRRQACPQPFTLSITPMGRLTCFPPSETTYR